MPRQASRTWTLLCLVMLGAGSRAGAQPVSLGDSDVRIQGVGAGDRSGHWIATAGDVNGDGYGDVLVTARAADGGNGAGSGVAWLVFGGAEPAGSLDLAELEPGAAVTIRGPAADSELGSAAAAAGDLNADGFVDLALAAPNTDFLGRDRAGAVYVIYGGPALPDEIDCADLGSAGMVIGGGAALDLAGSSVAGAGDFDGDGLDDLLVGARLADPAGRFNAGACYLILGSRDLPSSIDLGALGVLGIRFAGAADGDRAGHSSAGIGDFDGDDRDDIAIGSSHADPGGSASGAATIIFGTSGAPAEVDLGDLAGAGLDGFALAGARAGDHCGHALSGAGDFDGDGRADLLVSALDAPSGSLTSAGEVYLLFGSETPAALLDADDLGTAGITIRGTVKSGRLGASLASLGDLDGDGNADWITGAPGMTDGGGVETGVAYVFFGGTSLPALVTGTDLDDLALRFDGVASGDQAGSRVSRAGDLNGDGIRDILVSAIEADPLGRIAAGESYAILGQPALAPPSALVCESGSDGVALAWTNGASYDEIALLRGGVLVATLDGDAMAYADAAPPARSHVYGVRGIAGAATSSTTGCRVTVPEPPSDLACSLEEGTRVRLGWSLPAAESPFAAQVLALDPVAYWRLGESSGLEAVDAAGNQSAGYENGVALGERGALAGDDDTAAGFDGDDDRVTASGIDAAPEGLTLALWFRAADFETAQARLIAKAEGPDLAESWWFLSTFRDGDGRNLLRFRVRTEVGTATLAADAAPLEAGIWTFAVATYDGAELRVYKDGALVARRAHAGAPSFDAGVPVWLGQSPPAPPGTHAFHGVLDEVFVLDRALSEAGVQALFVAQIPRDTDYRGLVLGLGPRAYWRLGETAGSEAVEEIGAASGSYSGSFTLGDAGAIPGDGAVRFGSGGGAMEAADSEDLRIRGDLTLALWMRAASLDGATLLACGGTATDPSENTLYRVDLDASSVTYRHHDATGAEASVVLPLGAGLELERWYHIVLLRNAAGRQLALYVDGVRVATHGYPSHPAAGEASTLVAGAASDLASPFDGALDEVAVFDRLLGPEEIRSLGTPRFGAPEVRVRRDLEALATLDGAATEYVDPDILPGSYEYRVARAEEGVEGPSASCEVVVPIPVGSLVCRSTAAGVTLDWLNGEPYDLLRVERDGEIIEELSGTSTESLDPVTAGGDFGYTVRAVKGGFVSAPATCDVSVPAPVGALECNLDGTTATLGWTNSDTYDVIVVRRDLVEIAILDGATTSFVEEGVAAGTYEYDVLGRKGMDESPASACVVSNLAPPAIGECCSTDSEVEICWSTTAAFDSFEVRRDGTLVAVVAGDATCHESVAPGEGPFVYEIVGVAGAQHTPPATCTVAIPSAPALGDCIAAGAPCPGEHSVQLAWANGAGYDSLEIVRDDVSIATLEAGSSGYEDEGLVSGTYRYEVIGRIESGGTCASARSESCTITLADAPPIVIAAQPADTAACPGSSAEFSVVATGGGSLGYQWYFGAAEISGATAATLALDDVAAGDAGEYRVVVRGSCSEAVSDSALLTVAAVPVVVSVPRDEIACTGTAAVFSVVATSDLPVGYQWRHEGADIPGAAGAVLEIASVSAADAGAYAVVVSNDCGSVVSSAATLSVLANAAIIDDPDSASPCLGATVTLRSEGTGTPPIDYRWLKDGVLIDGADMSSYVISGFTESDAGSYALELTDLCGSVTSAPALLDVGAPPIITEQPDSVVTCADATVVLSIGATGSGTLEYQWRKDGIDVPGETEATLVRSPVGVGDSGIYEVVVSNDCGEATSDIVSISVAPGIAILNEPDSQSACLGDSVSFTIGATGGGSALSYQWRKDGVDIDGATSATYDIDAATLSDLGTYEVQVTAECGTALSSEAVLTFDDPPAITSDPEGRTVCDGAAVSFSVAASSASGLSYQWRRNGTNIAGATGTTFDIAAAGIGNAGDYDCVVSGDCGAATSAMATLVVDVGVSLLAEPEDVSACPGDDVTYAVSASGSGPFTYQWRKDGVDLPGATSAELLLTDAGADDAGAYSVRVENPCGSTLSRSADLDFPAAPTVADEPDSTTACEGESVSFGVTLAGASGVEYQWRRDGAEIPGAVSSVYTILDVTSGNAGDYDVVVSWDCGTVTSAAATLDIEPLPEITEEPLPQVECGGGSVTFTVAVDDPAGASYQWRRDGVDLPGATAASLTIEPVTGDDVGEYEVAITNSCGTVVSEPAALELGGSPLILFQPSGEFVCQGGTLSFSILVSSELPLTYQWSKDGEEIAGATGSTYTVSDAVPEDAGGYSVEVTNGCGSVTSNTAILIVLNPPAIFSQPDGGNVCTGGDVTLSVLAGGDLPLRYQWRKDGVDVAGATDRLFTLEGVTTADSGTYDVVVSHICDSTTSESATLIVDVPPEIGSSPLSSAVCEDASITLEVSASGTQPLGYQWRKNGVEISGATSASFTIGVMASADAASYDVLVSNVCGSATSAAGELTFESLPRVETLSGAQEICETASFTLVAGATGAAPLAYQWRKDGADIPGATGSEYTVGAATLSDAGTYQVAVTNDCASTLSSGIDVVVDALPVITDEPAGGTFCEATSVTLTVVAGGAAPLEYQWQKDGVDLAGATGASHTLAALSAADAGAYRVEVSNGCASVSSATIDIAVDLLPAISVQPVGLTVCAGEPAEFGVTALGAAPLGYQWRRDFEDIDGATGSTYTIDAATADDAGHLYDVVIENGCASVTSSVATLVVRTAPDIFTQPADTVACEGKEAVLSVIALGSTPLSFQWRKEGTAIAGATTANLSLISLDADDAGEYDVLVSNSCGEVTSEPATLTMDALPVIVTEPAAATVCSGDSVSFSVEVESELEVTYQWRKNGVNIAGATGSEYTIDAVTETSAGTYTVRVTSDCGAVTSSGALLTVDQAPAIATGPASGNYCLGAPFALSVVVESDLPPSYQWRRDGVEIAGATGSDYSVASATGDDSGDYEVVVTTDCGAVTSSTATVTVAGAPTIGSQPAPLALCDGEEGTLSVTASGVAPLAYQWRQDGRPIAGADEATLAIAATGTSAAGSYDVVVSDSCGEVVSEVVDVDVLSAPTIFAFSPSDEICEGDPVLLVVFALGSPPLAYEWRKDGVPIPGATSDTLEIDAATPEDAGSYDVAVANACGSVTSSASVLDVLALPVVSVEGSDITVCSGETVELVANATGDGMLAYQWQKDGADIPGATGTTLTIIDAGSTDAGSYRLVATNECGSTTGLEIALVVSDGPASAPTDLACAVGDLAGGTRDVFLSGSNPISDDAIEVRRNGGSIATLDGGAESFTDPDLGKGSWEYQVIGLVAGLGCAASTSEPCTAGVVIGLFLRGDTNRDGDIGIVDGIFLLDYLTGSGPAPPCLDAADVNDSGTVDIADAVYVLMYIFSDGDEPPAPFPDEGTDPTSDAIGCL